MTAALGVLGERGHISVEPIGVKTDPSIQEAAILLCRLSRARRLDEPEKDWVQLRDGLPMVEYAWAQAVKHGIPLGDVAAANAAREVLLRHHGVR